MSKVVQAANAMISHKDKISDVTQNANELYFLYDGKYRWSVLSDNDDYVLFFYQTNISIQELASLPMEGLIDVNLIRYSANEIGTKEAIQTFRELYLILKEKVLGIDEVLDDIIEEDIPF